MRFYGVKLHFVDFVLTSKQWLDYMPHWLKLKLSSLTATETCRNVHISEGLDGGSSKSVVNKILDN